MFPVEETLAQSTSGISDFFLVRSCLKIATARGERLFSRTLTSNGLCARCEHMGRGHEGSDVVRRRSGHVMGATSAGFRCAVWQTGRIFICDDDNDDDEEDVAKPCSLLIFQSSQNLLADNSVAFFGTLKKYWDLHQILMSNRLWTLSTELLKNIINIYCHPSAI